MNKSIKFMPTLIDGAIIILPKENSADFVFDEETYNLKDMSKHGIKSTFVQDNEVMSKKGVLRGLHYQKNYSSERIVRVIFGKIYDVAVDMRDGSPTFGKWHAEILSSENHKQFYLANGLAHGYYVMEDNTIVAYKTTTFWHPEREIGIPWNDPYLNIEWPIPIGESPLLTEKDKSYPPLVY